MKRLLLFFAAISLLTSCSDQKIDTTKAREEMESREIRRVTDGEIVKKAFEMGASEDVKGQFVAIDSIDQFSGKTFEVLDAYAYNYENDLESEPSVQILEGDTVLLYAQPQEIEGRKGVLIKMLSKKDLILNMK